MTEQGKRLGKGVAVALAVHVLLAALLGLFGYRFAQRPPQILEVTLSGGGGGGAKASQPQLPQPPQAEQPDEPVVPPDPDAIVEQRKEPQRKQPPRQTRPSAPAAAPRESSAAAAGEGEDGEASSGKGAGSGEGSGEGSGSGGGSGSGSGQGTGAGAGAPATPPYLLSSVEPRYPAAARNREIEGTVYVKMLVSAGGGVESAAVARSSGSSALDGAAVEAVYRWRFSPAKDVGGAPVRCYITVPVHFKLH